MRSNHGDNRIGPVEAYEMVKMIGRGKGWTVREEDKVHLGQLDIVELRRSSLGRASGIDLNKAVSLWR